jgi:NADH-quinone oxidoreductase subunit H
MIASDLNIGVLYVMALGSVSMAILMAGWGSNNKYALLGAFRAVAQLIAYEVPMALSLVTVVLLSGTLSTYGIVLAQAPAPFIAMIPGVFIVYFLCGIAEIGRSPFDLLEADSEIVAGYNIEYSGMKFALFYISEYFNLFTIAAMIVTLFLGGWQWPILPSYVWFMLKVIAVVFGMMWIRGTWPRIRIDQMLNLSWKVLVPTSLVNLFYVALIVKLIPAGWLQGIVLLVGNVIIIAVALGLMGRAARKHEQKVQALAAKGLTLQPSEE